jgi:hypothetical protein
MAEMPEQDEQGITIQLSAVELEAVLEGETVERQQATLGNRIIGALRRHLGFAKRTPLERNTSFGSGAAQVRAVRAGEISLMPDQAEGRSEPGGHTLLRHVDKDEAFLRQRIAETAGWRNPPKAISYFTDLRTVERHISRAFRANRKQIAKWSRTAASGTTMRPEIIFDAGKVVGYGVVRATDQLAPMSRMRIILRKGPYNRLPHYILTAYPIS